MFLYIYIYNAQQYIIYQPYTYITWRYNILLHLQCLVQWSITAKYDTNSHRLNSFHHSSLFHLLFNSFCCFFVYYELSFHIILYIYWYFRLKAQELQRNKPKWTTYFSDNNDDHTYNGSIRFQTDWNNVNTIIFSFIQQESEIQIANDMI